ncbi:MAG TPA: hypothetical protein VGR78_19420 [Verrucomicrobiae bacterium]|jgi:hypothetical protein|nr:hypothetical protein [Verrucomicrobiae bacterium]
MFDPAEVVRALNKHGVEYLIIGGFAATLYGCPEQTFDIDILFADSAENRKRLVGALQEVKAEWDRPLTAKVLTRQPLFALNSAAGDIDIFRVVPGMNSFEEFKARLRIFELKGQHTPVLSLLDLIATKEAAADPNPRKQSALAYLKNLANETSSQGNAAAT